MSNSLMRLARRVARKPAIAAGTSLHRLQDAIAHATLPRFATPAPGLVIKLPREISHPERMHLGENVKLGPNSILKVNTGFPGGWLRHPEGEHVAHEFDPVLHIGDRVTATAGLQITVFERVTIDDDVMFAANVFIADGTHASERGDIPYKYQGIDPVKPIHIGRGAWLGQNVVVLPGVTIGANALIGANSVVTNDVPSSSVALGAPARVVRQWDAKSETWQDGDRVGRHPYR